MKHFSFKKVLAIVLSLAIVMSFVPMTVSAAGTDVSSITVEDGVVTLNLDYANTYYSDTSSLSDITAALMQSALETYNTANGTALTGTNIKGLKVTTQPGVKLIKTFNSMLTTNFPQLEVLDMSGSVVTANESSTQSLADNYMYSGYFTGLTNLKKVLLPAGLVRWEANAFKGLTNLEEVVLSDSLENLVQSAFEGCTALTKIDLPVSLYEVSVWQNAFDNSGITEFSFHGTAYVATANSTAEQTQTTFFTRLTTTINKVNYTKLDLSNSGIDETNVLTLANKASLTYIDLTGCTNIDFTTTDGITLKAKLQELKANGVTVKMPVEEEEPEPEPEPDNGDTSSITVEDGTVTLNIDYANTYYSDTGSLNDVTAALMQSALNTYNTANSTELTSADIKGLKVKTASGVKLIATFNTVIKTNLPQLEVLDMSESVVTANTASTTSMADNYLPGDYFVGMSSLKKVVLPAGLVTLKSGAFSSLKNLEEVVIGDALEEIGFAAFYGCSKLTKIDLPASLKILSSSGGFFEASGIKEFSFHGTAENAADKVVFFQILTTAFNQVNYSKIDLSNSGIDETNALAIANAGKSNLTYLDFSGCEDINFTTTDGQALKSKLAELIANGVNVKLPIDASFITVSGSTVTLTLNFANTYYDTQSTGYDNPSDIRGATLNLINAALNTYNTANGTTLAISDIDNLTVKTAPNARLTYRFPEILKAKLPQLVEIDMSDSAVTKNCYAGDNLDDNWMLDNYFVGMTSLKKVVLPVGLVTLRSGAFSGLKNLEEVVIGDALEDIGFAAFYGCSKLTKIDLPASLKTLSSSGGFFDSSGIKEFSFHGTADKAADKTAFFATLVTAFNKVNYTKMDLNGSGIDENNAIAIAQKASFTYLDIRNCPIDYTTPRGQALKNKLTEYKAENPGVTLLWDDGIVGDTDYTEVSAVITLNAGDTMANALTAWETATGAKANTITDLVIKTAGSRKLDTADYTKLQEVIGTSLRKVDLTGAALNNDTIPSSAFKFAVNLFEVKFPESLKNIGNEAFYGTKLNTLTLPEGLEVIGTKAFDRCLNMGGELILPNGLKTLGDGAFTESAITKLEYHGPVDLKLTTNFAYSLSTLEHLDLRGCTAITRDTFPIGNTVSWAALEELNLDFCSIQEPYVFFSNWIKSFTARPTITASCQFKSYDSVEEMLAYPIYGKQYEDYEDFDGSVIIYDHGVYELQDVEEGTGTSIPAPGTENWSSNANAYDVKISNESIGNFQYYGWYITEYEARYYDKLTTEQKELYNQYVFDREGVNFVPLMVNTDFYYQNEEMGTYYDSFESSWKVGTGGLIDEIAERNLPVFATLNSIPYWMKGDGPYLLEQGMAEDFAKATVNMVCDLVDKTGLNVVYVSIGDEPDGGYTYGDMTCVDHYSFVLPLLRQYLDERKLNDVGIFGPETCNFSTPFFTKMRSMDSAWSNLAGVSGHGFGFGIMSEAAMYQSRAYNMPIFITSTGIEQGGTVAGDYLTTTSTGEQTVADYYSAIRNVVGLIHDVNLGANAYASWAPSAMIANNSTLDTFNPSWSHIYMSTDTNVFSNGVAKSATFDYFSAALDTVQPGAKIYYASTEDTDMTSQGYTADTKLSVNAGINPDGTWGINILNRTDSTILAPHSSELYAAQPAPAETMIINLDIVGLYGTGTKEFKMYSTNTQGGYYEDLGTVTLVDGRGYVEVDSLEMISLKSVESIPLNNKPLALSEEIEDLNIAFAGYDYMFKNGSKIELNAKPEQWFNEAYTNPSMTFEAEDFANLIGGTYKLGTKGVIWKTTYAEITYGNNKITITDGSQNASYSGRISGTLKLAEAAELRDGKIYFTIQDNTSSTISDIFGISYNQYISSGIVVVGETDIVNVSRLNKSSISETLSNEFAGLRNCTSEIKVNGDTTELVLDLGHTYYETTWNNAVDGGFTSSDTLDGRYNFNLLMEGALKLYNLNKDTTLTATDINKLTITTKEGNYLTPVYAAFVKVKLPHLVELDLSNAAFNGGLRSYDAAYDNVIPSPAGNTGVSYAYSLSGANQDSIMPNLKKLSLPKGVTTISSSTFRNLRALECLVLPDNVSIGYDSFTYCDNLKTIVAHNVTSVKDWWNNRSGCIENIIFTGTQLNFYDDEAAVQTLPGNPTLYCKDAAAYAGVNEANKARFTKVVFVEDMSRVNVVDGNVELTNGDKLFGGYTLVEGEEKVYTVKWNSPELLSKWVQHKAVEDTYTLRFVSTVDSLDYQNVGFAVSLYNSNPTIGGVKSISDTSTKVYSSLQSNGAQASPVEAGAHESAEFFFAYKLTGVPADFDGTIYIRPFYTTIDGPVVYGTTSAITLAAVIA